MSGGAADNRKRQNSISASAVTFESPGTRDVMMSLQTNMTGLALAIDEFNIVGYFSYPNLVNTCNKQMGTRYSLTHEIGDQGWFASLSGQALRQIHSMDNIVRAFADAPHHRVERHYMTDWPQGNQRSTYFAQVSYDGDSGKYAWKTPEQTVSESFKLTFTGHHEVDERMSTWQRLPLVHFSQPLQDWLILFYESYRRCDEGQLRTVRQAWVEAGIAPHIIGLLASSQLVRHDIAQGQLYIEINAASLEQTAEWFRGQLSNWLSSRDNVEKSKVLLQCLQQTVLGVSPPSGSVEAILVESGANVTATGLIERAKVRALVVQVPKDSDAAEREHLVSLSRQLMDDIHQAGIKVRVVGIERGATFAGTARDIDLAAVEVTTGGASTTAPPAGTAALMAQQQQRERLLRSGDGGGSASAAAAAAALDNPLSGGAPSAGKK